MRKILFIAASFIMAIPAWAGDLPVDARIERAMLGDHRSQENIDRNRYRHPVGTLTFLGLEDGMTVMEIWPGGGWYTRVLAPVLADNGKLYVALGTGRVSDSVLTEPGFEKVEVIETDANIRRPEGSRYYALDDFEFGLSGVDMVLTFRNVHNFDAESRARMNRAVFDVLKPGGLYGVVDHTKRHMEPENPENRRRIDPVLVIKEMLDIGFEFVGYSDLHYRAEVEARDLAVVLALLAAGQHDLRHVGRKIDVLVGECVFGPE